jgi:hypothetical protein
MQIRISGGSRLSEQNALTVIPWSDPSAAFVVTTVTPDGNLPSTLRNSSELTLKFPGPER